VNDGCAYTVYTCSPCQQYINDFDLWEQYKYEGEMEAGAVIEDMKFNNGISEEFYWIKVRYFGYGGEKWD
jgi:hypothetical protein